ncbi:MAG: ribonuclease III family protein [Candidatus Hodarchaeota archaeon]
MAYEFLIKDLNRINSQKSIGTDKGLAKIGDAIVNLTYSVAKSIYLTRNSLNKNKILRTGLKVSKIILADALKNADMKGFAKNRADAHDLANTVEAIIAFIWLSNKMSINEIIDFLTDNFSGPLESRIDEIRCATTAFSNFLIYIRKYLPQN